MAAVVLAGSVAQAAPPQDAARKVPYAEVLELMDTAQHRVVLYAPSVFDVTLANRLRQASLDRVRDVKVLVLTIQFFNYNPDSLVNSLVLAGVPVYEANVPSKDGVLVIDNYVFTGPGLGRVQGPGEVYLLRPSSTNRYLSWFQGIVSKAPYVTRFEAWRRLNRITP